MVSFLSSPPGRPSGLLPKFSRKKKSLYATITSDRRPTLGNFTMQHLKEGAQATWVPVWMWRIAIFIIPSTRTPFPSSMCASRVTTKFTPGGRRWAVVVPPQTTRDSRSLGWRIFRVTASYKESTDQRHNNRFIQVVNNRFQRLTARVNH